MTISLDGRLDAFNVLVLRHQARIRATCRGIVGMADADDLMQEAFIKAWDRLSTYKQRGKFPAWLGVIARRTCFDHLRQRQRRPSTSLDRLTDVLGDQFAPQSGERSLDEHLMNIELSGALREALDSLSEDQRRAVFYRDVMDMEYREIVDAHGLVDGYREVADQPWTLRDARLSEAARSVGAMTCNKATFLREPSASGMRLNL